VCIVSTIVKGEDTMSKLTRIALALVFSLVIVAGVYFSVQALSVVAVRQQGLGMYMLNGALTNPIQKEAVQESVLPELKTYPNGGEGHEGDCERDGDNSSDL
jgi:amino acid transporter